MNARLEVGMALRGDRMVRIRERSKMIWIVRPKWMDEIRSGVRIQASESKPLRSQI
jgi:hypothetical protein